MDPNANYDELMALVNSIAARLDAAPSEDGVHTMDDDAIYRLIDLWQGLDHWLRHDGYLPKAWHSRVVSAGQQRVASTSHAYEHLAGTILGIRSIDSDRIVGATVLRPEPGQDQNHVLVADSIGGRQRLVPYMATYHPSFIGMTDSGHASKEAIDAAIDAGLSGVAIETEAARAAHMAERENECGVTYQTGGSDPSASDCDLPRGHGGQHAADDPLDVERRIHWTGGGRLVGDRMVPKDVWSD